METLDIVRSALSEAVMTHDEARHPADQGFALPLVGGIVAYFAVLPLALLCVALVAG